MNAPYKELADVECEFCNQSCKNLFCMPKTILYKWGFQGYYHWECALDDRYELYKSNLTKT